MRLYSLDVLRGLAAIGVVLYHWGAFFAVPGSPPGMPADFDVSSLPLSAALFVFYRVGYLGVDLFFCLSGFVFFWLYSDDIAAGRVGGREFAALRFSRLYPLHLATLVYVAVGQMLHVMIAGGPFVFTDNSATSFLRQALVFFPAGFGRTYAFNAPVWSVCIEALLYLAFFLLCRIERPRPHVLWLLVLVSYGTVQQRFPDMAQGLCAFFAGGLVWMAYKRLSASPFARRFETALKLFLTSVWTLTVFCIFTGKDMENMERLQWLAPCFPLLLLALTLLYVVLLERSKSWPLQRFSWLGDISYSVYLLHFPLMLTAATLTDGLGIGRELYQSPIVLLAFFAALIGLSLFSFHRFERPMQTWIRRALASQRRSDDVQSRRGPDDEQYSAYPDRLDSRDQPHRHPSPRAFGNSQQ